MKNDQNLNYEQGKRLRECRKACSMTQEELAEKTGYSIQHISKTENGKQRINADSARIYSKILKVRIEYLLCEDNFKTPSDYMKNLTASGPMKRLLDLFGLEVMEMETDFKENYWDTKDSDERIKIEEKLNELIDDIQEYASFKLKSFIDANKKGK